MGDPTNNRFYRKPQATHMPSGEPIRPLSEYRDEFNTTRDAEEGYTAAVRLATVLMWKHWPEAVDWQPAPDLLGVITQLDHITAHLHGCFAGPVPEPFVSMPPAADDGAPCTLADRVGTSAMKEAEEAWIEALHVSPKLSCDDRVAILRKAQHILGRSPRRDRFANDEAAKALYDTWSDRPGWVPWVERGNSLMQERARREETP